jgi:phosphoglycolate phosphatase
VDSRRDLAESVNVVLRGCGCATRSEEAIGRMVGDGAATLVRRAFAAAGCPQPPDALERFLTTYNSRLLKFTRPYDGVTDLLAKLSSQLTLGVLTNKPLHATRAILDGLDLTKYFGPRVVGGDGPLPRKPDPAGLRHLLDQAQVRPDEAMLVGDSMIDWQSARAASVPSCLAAYGFGFEGFPEGRLGANDCVIDHPLDLLRIL